MSPVPYDGNVKLRDRIQPADLPEAWNKAAELVKQWQGLIPAEFLEEYRALKESKDLYGVKATMYPEQRLDASTLALIKTASGIEVLDQLFKPKGPSEGFTWATIGDYHNIFKSAKATPVDVVKQALKIIDETNALPQPLRAFIRTNPSISLKLAEESAARYKAGKPLSVFDGLPMGFKDTNALEGWITGSGTEKAAKLATADEDWVANLKKLGAIPVGITLSSETANTAFGPNVLHGLPLNPFAPKHITGASSAGTAVAVAAGLMPLCTGSDGAGSVRIPSSWCGNYGIKTTFGRCGVMETQASPLSVQGPHAMDADSMAAGFWAMARKDGEHVGVPPPSLLNYTKIQDLSDLRIGIYPDWFADADPRVVDAARDLLGRLEARGAKIVTLELQFSVAMAMGAHHVNFGCWIRNNYRNQDFGREGIYADIQDLATRVELAQAELLLTDNDYFQMMRAKTVVTEKFREAFKQVDAIIFPSTAVPAPESHPLDVKYGRDDPANEQRYNPFTPIANLIGTPSVSVPSGYIDAADPGASLPLGTQFYGSWWREDILLRIANACEDILLKGELKAAKGGKRKPVLWWDALEGLK